MPGLVADEQAAKARKPTKNEQRRARKKQLKREVIHLDCLEVRCPSNALTARQVSATPAPELDSESAPPETHNPEDASANRPLLPVEPVDDDPIQAVPDIETFDLPPEDPLYKQFAGVFAKFQETDEQGSALKEPEKPEVFYDDDDNIQGEDEETETKHKLSKKARKAATKLTVAELKAVVRKPETVEWTDISSIDPKLLVNIKGARNVVPVPGHWALKREYLSSKRGIEKAGFALPKFIAETGIAEMREAVLEQQAEASLKSKQRERVQPKMGKLDIDYQKLFEAFFRRQSKPHLTRYGEVYYEGKEYETNLRHLRPGEFSDELKEALNMPPGAPPPWLINMQRFGPPPNYPAMRIPGLNAPPPPGAQWGFHPGGYGKPPIDDQGAALWGGDVFGLDTVAKMQAEGVQPRVVEPPERSLWGELQPLQEEVAEEEEEDEEDDEDEDEKGGEGADGKEEPVGAGGEEVPFGGMETPGGIYSTIPTEMGTQSMAEEFDLRKRRRGTETEETSHPRAAGQVIRERSIRAEGFFGGERAYDLRAANVPTLGADNNDRGKKRKAGDLDVSVDVDALEREDGLSKDEVKKNYEAARQRERQGQWSGKVDQEDLSQMVAEESAKRLKREQDRKKGR